MSRVTIDDGILTDIADAIRTQLGENDKINPLDFTDCILAIGSGSGENSNLPFVYECGEFELLENVTDTTNGYEIEHGHGSLPVFVACWIDGIITNTSIPAFSSIGCTHFINSSGTPLGAGTDMMVNYQKTHTTSSRTLMVYATDDTFVIKPYDTSYPWRTGFTYKWIAIFSE